MEKESNFYVANKPAQQVRKFLPLWISIWNLQICLLNWICTCNSADITCHPWKDLKTLHSAVTPGWESLIIVWLAWPFKWCWKSLSDPKMHQYSEMITDGSPFVFHLELCRKEAVLSDYYAGMHLKYQGIVKLYNLDFSFLRRFLVSSNLLIYFYNNDSSK